ncbi:MAG: DUF1343 domain-containing protein [Flavobacteriales bacterium]|nr:DUF1343 domain-containing protein [Flavobacteriales bacterium]
MAVVSNHTGVIGETHLVDTLISRGVDVIRVFAPEHGFRGDVPDGETVKDERDKATGIKVVSLYGKNKKPSPEALEGVDRIVFDIQDVGARFYTYLSTLHYAMEAAAEERIPLVVLDRPNPNGHYIDGPVMRESEMSFVGMHPVPVVYGMTIGEYAQMINGEGWLANSVKCDLQVFEIDNYTHSSTYTLPIAPSPNLPDMKSIYLYPSLCFFEGTNVSVGRGTNFPFSVIGEPGNTSGTFSFVPESKPGASVSPKHKGVKCTGYDLRDSVNLSDPPAKLQLNWLLRMYTESENKASFFNKNGYFDRLAGNSELRKAVIAGKSQSEIRESWKEEIAAFKTIRMKYLIYPNS